MLVQALIILLAISGLLAAGCFGFYGVVLSAMGGWIIGIPMLAIGGAIGFYSLRYLYRSPIVGPSGEVAASTFSADAQAILTTAATGDAEARYLAGKMLEHGEHGVAANRDTALQWYQLAEAQGHAGATKRLKEMSAE